MEFLILNCQPGEAGGAVAAPLRGRDRRTPGSDGVLPHDRRPGLPVAGAPAEHPGPGALSRLPDAAAGRGQHPFQLCPQAGALQDGAAVADQWGDIARITVSGARCRKSRSSGHFHA